LTTKKKRKVRKPRRSLKANEQRRSRRRVFIYAASLAVAATFLSPIGYATLYAPDVDPLRHENPGLTALQKQRAEEAVAAGRAFRMDQRWVPLGEISEHLVNAVIVSEDATFWTHGGFDFHEIGESIKKNWRERRLARGASTITQQLAKNLFFGTEKSWRRKLLEAIATYRLERKLSKRRILEIYLNVIEWGPGVYGAEAAAQHHFGLAAKDLKPHQAALLAASIPSPHKMRPGDPGPFLRDQADLTLERMRARGMLETPD